MRKKNQPLVSVIMPVYNGEPFLNKAVESIINQTYKNWELLVVDDKSTDNSYKILKDYAKKDKRIKVLQNKQKGYLAGSLNYALTKVKGTYIARMDADDISLPNRFERQVEFLEKNKNILAVGCFLELINEEDQVIGEKFFPTDPKACYRMIMNMMPIQPPTLMARANIMKKLKYDTGVARNDDIDMHFQLLQYGRFSNVDEILFQYRKRASSYTFSAVKKVFYMAFQIRMRAIRHYGYRPTLFHFLLFLAESLVVSILPSQVVLFLFELIRVKPKTSKFNVLYMPTALQSIKAR